MTGIGSSCGACKFLRRKCAMDCVFAPYFCYEEAAVHFAAVHKVFGASNVSKLLSHLPLSNRSEAAITMSYEALARMHDPVYGCVSQIFALQQQVASLQEEIETLGNQMTHDAVLDVSNVVNSQEMTSFCHGLQASSQLNEINAQSCLSQEALLLPQTGNGFCSQMMNMEVPREDQNCGSWSDVSLMERLFQGMDYGSYTI